MRAILILTLLAACSKGGVVDTVRARVEGTPPPIPSRPDDSCHSQMFREYVGQPESVLYGLVFAQPMRVIPPDSAVTQDYSPVRINFDLDYRGNISRVWCG